MSNETQKRKYKVGDEVLVRMTISTVVGRANPYELVSKDALGTMWVEESCIVGIPPDPFAPPDPTPRPKRKRGPTLSSVVESNANLKLGLERLRLRLNRADSAIDMLAKAGFAGANAQTAETTHAIERMDRLNDQVSGHEVLHADQWQRLQKLQTRQTRFERKVKIGAAIILVLAAAFAILAIGPHAAMAWVEGAWRR